MKTQWISIPAAVLMIIGAGQTLADEALAEKSGCLECHSVDKKIIGPAFQDIAMMYKDDAGARDALIETVKHGGKHNWAEANGVPMPPHSGLLSKAEIEHLVDWVLGLQEEN